MLRLPREACLLLGLLACCCLIFGGCKRSFFRQAADRQAYGIVSEKYCEAGLEQPNVSIEPDARSRFYDPTCPTDPSLPIPAPQLYNYQLPELVTGEVPPRQFSRPMEIPESESPSDIEPSNELLPSPEGQQSQLPVTLASSRRDSTQPVSLASPLAFSTTQTDEELKEALALLESFGLDAIRNTPPVPQESWNSLPSACLKRMLEFPEVQREYERSFNVAVTEDRLDPARRVSLANILEIALINNRNYQRQKELLYVTALRLSIQRFDYDLKFFSRGNGSSLDYVHNRVSGVEVNRLAIPTNLGVTKSLYTAGDLAARFANDVVLTFNGASGYSSTVSSELLVELSQPLIQRDIQFEALTQAERDVIYAARDFVRFRKVLFSDLASRYYALLLTYRSIAINTQDFFSNLSGFNRSAAYESVGQLPRFQVDQFEQSVLRSRGSLISACNSLERALDQLKFTIGLPPEMPLNLDLSELESLTLRDEATVIRAQINRKRDYVNAQLKFGGEVAVPAAAEVVRRMRNLEIVLQKIARETEIQEARNTTNDESNELAELNKLVARLEAEDKRIEAQATRQFLEQSQSGTTQLLPGQILGRTLELVETTLEVVQAEIRLLQLSEESELGDVSSQPEGPVAASVLRWARLVNDLNALSDELQQTSSSDRIDAFPRLIASGEAILARIEMLEKDVVGELEGYGIVFANSTDELKTLATFVVEESGKGKFAETGGLAELQVDVDEAMLTALVQRLDLMNVRGELADQWRDIKYAGDALKGILNINASQSIRTEPGDKEPFDFSFDNSTTRLGLNFDTPLNRRLERNNYRTSLINYNVALRNLIQAQDSIKLDIRNDLREIELDRDQYDISIASAALAYERVASTRIQLALGQGNVTARDFLEAQQAYTESLSSVANRHIAYIVDRIQFFLDLEQLQVDQFLFWGDLRNEDYQFLPNLDFPGTNPRPYGNLACGPWYSECLRRMERVPPGVSMIHPKPGESEPVLQQADEAIEESISSDGEDQMIDLVPPIQPQE